MRIAVVGLRGGPTGQPIEGHFGEAGGTIGRAAGSTLMLDDPERTVSRVHAQVVCRGGNFFIVDRGSNALLCNGQPLGAGNEAPLNNGDRLVIGSFELQVHADAGARPMASPTHAFAGGAGAAPAADDPFAGLLDGLVAPTPAAPAKPAPKLDQPIPGLTSAASANPMEFRAAQAPDPFADLLGPGPSAPAGGGIPDDFSDLGIPKGGASSSIDALFGLDSTTRGSDPFANSLLADPLSQPNTATGNDPLAALQNVAKPTSAAHGNHVSMLNQAFVAPTASPAVASTSASALPDLVLDDFSDLLGPQTTPQAAPAPTPKPAAASPSAPALPDLVLDDFSDLLGPQTTPQAAPTAAPLVPAAKTAAAVAPILPPEPFLDPVTMPPSAPAKAPAPAPAGPSAAARAAVGQASDSELLAAFLRGVDSNHQMPVALTPGLMERIGGMLRSATEGTVHLLLTRQEIKREVHAAVTMIGSQNNNPLKFSPTVEVALGHLLGPNIKGFMPAPEAMRDAFNDLRAHQLGVMVGMQAAMDHMLSRFTPEALEKTDCRKVGAGFAVFSQSQGQAVGPVLCVARVHSGRNQGRLEQAVWGSFLQSLRRTNEPAQGAVRQAIAPPTDKGEPIGSRNRSAIPPRRTRL